MTEHTLTVSYDVESLHRDGDMACDADDHALAIVHYGAALALLTNRSTTTDLGIEYDLRAGRAACYHAISEYPSEANDLAAMAALATALGDPRRQIATICRQVTLDNLLGNAAQGRQAAEAALAQARTLGDSALEADCLCVLGDACYYLSRFERAEAHFGQALGLYRSIGDQQGEAYSLRSLGETLAALGRQLQAREHIEAARAIYRSLGDAAEEARTMVFLGLITVDNARRRAALEEALRLTANHADRFIRARLINSLGNLYATLGLYKRSHDYVSQAVTLARTLQLRVHLAWYLDSLGQAYLGMHDEDVAYQCFDECATICRSIGEQSTEGYAWLGMGRAALVRGQFMEAQGLFKAASERFASVGQPGEQANALAHLGAAMLALNDVAAALACTAEATALVDAGHISSDFPSQESWWWRYQALMADDSGDSEARWSAIQRAHELMLAVVATLSDAGLRRSYLNKIEINRAILIAWSHATRQHDIVTSALDEPVIDVREQLTRMIGIGSRMSEQRDTAGLRTFLLDELIELSGAERALLLLQAPDASADRSNSGALAQSWGLTPAAAEELCIQAAPILAEAIRTRKPVRRQDLPDPLATAQDTDRLPALMHHSVLVVPLIAGARLIGILYADMRAIFGQFTQADLDLLAVLASQATTALENARLYEATLLANRELERRVAERTADLEQRAAELAAANARLEQRSIELTLLNSVQQGLAAQLDMQAILELVGDKIREIFDAQVVDIGIYDRASGLLHYPYWIERGVRYPNQPTALFGIYKHVMETRQPMVINSDIAQSRTLYDSPQELSGGEPAKSVVFVPLVVGEEAKGYISIQNLDHEHAFPDSDVRLLSTLAASMSVAIENARLFDESNRLLAETEQRAAELALINSVQQSFASQLNFQAIFDLVGNKIRDIFDAQVVDIAVYDRGTDMLHSPYWIERGVRYPSEPIALFGFRKYVIETRQPLVINNDMERARTLYNSPVIWFEAPKSAVFVPLVVGDEAKGYISLQDLDREDAFSDSDVRLLSTLAASMSMAIENARLFGETKRLLAETEQRAAELAVINRIQQSLAAQLDIQMIFDLVGDKIRDIFNAQVVDIALYDRATNLLYDAYAVERGVRLPNSLDRSPPYTPFGFRQYVVETLQPLLVNEAYPHACERYGNPLAVQGEVPKSVLFVPLVVGDQVKGYISLQNLDHEHAFSDSDVRLLSTLAASMSVALENARLFDETKRLLAETAQRAAELVTVNRIGQALASELELEALIALTGEQVRQTFAADAAYVALRDGESDVIQFPYYYEHGVWQSDSTIPYGEGLTSQIIISGQPLLLNERIEEFEARTGFTQIGTRVKSFLGVPIMAAQQAIGVISVQSTQLEGRFGDADLRLLATIAANVGVAIQNARLFQETKRRAGEMTALAEVSRDISATLNLAAVLDRIAAHAYELLGGRDVVLRLLEPDGRLPAVVTLGKYAEVYRDWQVQIGYGLTGHVAQSGVAEIVNDPLRDPRVARIAGTEVDEEHEAMILAPLIARDNVIGVLTVWRDKTISGPFSQTDLDFSVGLARQAAIAIENARLFAEIQRQKQFSDALIEASPVAIIHEDLNEHVISWNPAAAALFGYTSAEALGRHLDDLVANRSDVRQDADRYTRATWQKGDPPHHGIGRRTRKDGQLVDVEFFGVPIIVGGQDVAGISLYHDITELLKARQEAIAANEAKSAFLANMSHELRTPLNAVLGFAQLMERDTALAPRQKEHLSIITRSGEHLLNLINDVLEMSKIEAGQITLNEAPFDLRALVRNVEDLFRLRAESKGLRLQIEMAADVPQYVTGDESKLRQILINLLGNAIKFTETGGVALRAAWHAQPRTENREPRTENHERDGGSWFSVLGSSSLAVEVEDTGVGIAADQLPGLFQPFVQTSSGGQAHEGTGLGLAITRQFVRLLGGDITVTSTFGQGSVFRFDLPLTAIDHVPTPALAERRVIGVVGDAAAYRMLVVDDKWENRRLLVEWLSAAGFAVREASNGEEALNEWEQWEPHLIWMDMRMPVLDGYAATRRIKATLKGQATVIIALTASAFEHEQAIVLSAGCDDFVRKPVRESVIFEKIARHLGIQFVYAEQSIAGATADDGATLRSALAALPPDWRASLQQAILMADMEQIKALAQQIHARDQRLAAGIARLADDLRLDQLYLLIQA